MLSPPSLSILCYMDNSCYRGVLFGTGNILFGVETCLKCGGIVLHLRI